MGFKHSSLFSILIDSRIDLTKINAFKSIFSQLQLMRLSKQKLGLLIDQHFSVKKFKTTVTVIHNATGQQGKNFSYVHEYCYFMYILIGTFY